MGDDEPLKKPRRCRCGKFPRSYFEPWSSGPVFEADDQGRPSEVGDVQPGIPRGMVFASCSCGRTWRLRGVRQITEMERSP